MTKELSAKLDKMGSIARDLTAGFEEELLKAHSENAVYKAENAAYKAENAAYKAAILEKDKEIERLKRQLLEANGSNS